MSSRSRKTTVPVKLEPQYGLCYICGVAASLEHLETSMSDVVEGAPVFPWLRTVNPAPGAESLCPTTGRAKLCLLCHQLMIQQWRLYENEKPKQPVASRQYWSKSWPNNSSTAATVSDDNSLVVSECGGRNVCSESDRTPNQIKGEISGGSSSQICLLCTKRISSTNCVAIPVSLPGSQCVYVCTECLSSSTPASDSLQMLTAIAAQQMASSVTPSLAPSTAVNSEFLPLLYSLIMQHQSATSTAANNE